MAERLGDHIYESLVGFATYRYLPDGKTVYIIDIYVLPEHRRDGHASFMADKIVLEAKEKGCTRLTGTILPSALTSSESMLTLLKYGLKIESLADGLIVLGKEI